MRRSECVSGEMTKRLTTFDIPGAKMRFWTRFDDSPRRNRGSDGLRESRNLEPVVDTIAVSNLIFNQTTSVLIITMIEFLAYDQRNDYLTPKF